MPELQIEQRRSAGIPWWVWLIGACLAVLVIGWIISANTSPRQLAEGNPINPVTATTPTAPGTDANAAGTATTERSGAASLQSSEAWFPVAAIRANPDNYFDTTVSGVVEVQDAAGSHGFWTDKDGNRMFIALEVPMASLNVGDLLGVTGTVRDPQHMEQDTAVMQLPAATRRDLQNSPAYIHATQATLAQRPKS